MSPRIIILLIVIFIMPCRVFSQNRYARDNNGQFIVAVGDEMPSFQYTTLQGDTLDSDFLRGQVCIIQFVASWCPFGKGQIRAVEDMIWRKYGLRKRRGYNNDIAIIGFTEDFPQDTAQFRMLLNDYGISYPFVFDTDESIFRLFATPKASVTRLIIIDRDGKIVALEDEFYRDTFKRTRKTIKKLLKQH